MPINLPSSSDHVGLASGHRLMRPLRGKDFGLLRLALTILALTLSTPGLIQPAQARNDLDEKLNFVRQLNATSHWRSGRSVLEQLEPELARASLRQRNRYDLALAHNLALGGAPAAGLELIEHILAREPAPTLRLHALWLAANLATAERSDQRAFGYIREGMELLPEVDDAAARAGLLGVAGLTYARVGEVEQGIELARRAIHHARQVPADHPGSSRCIAGQRLSAALALGTDATATLEAAKAALQACETEENGHFAGALESLIGQLHLAQNDLDESEGWLQRALERLTTIGHLGGIRLTQLRLMELALRRAEPAPDAAFIDQLAGYFQRRRYWDRKAHTHHLAARFAERDRAYSSAVEHLRREAVAQERFFAWERARRSAYLEVEFNMDQQRRELALLKEQARVEELEQTTDGQETSLQRVVQASAGVLILLLMLMLSRASRQRRHFQSLACRDGLTELLNHTSFFESADQLLQDCIESDRSYWLAVGDIDHFKQINDRSGHLVGDTVLQRVASRMRDQFPKPDILGRIGGEEFAIALPDAEFKNVRGRIEALRREINAGRQHDQKTRVTMSFGLARFNGSETIEMLRKRADEALYKAKQSGRDRLVSADGE